MGAARGVRDLTIQQDIRRKDRLVLLGTRRQRSAHKIGADNRIGRTADHRFEMPETVVQIVITQPRRVAAQRCQCCYHRMRSLARVRGKVVAHRIALDQVAVVEEKAVRHLRPCRTDHRREPCQPEAVGRAVGIVVMPPESHMEIGGRQHPQLYTRQSHLLRLAFYREARKEAPQ